MQTVNITWTSTNDNTGVAILDYQILLVDTVTKLQRNFEGIKDSSLYVTGLHYNRTYQVYVKARNENEYGRFEGNNFTTLEAGLGDFQNILVLPFKSNAAFEVTQWVTFQESCLCCHLDIGKEHFEFSRI